MQLTQLVNEGILKLTTAQTRQLDELMRALRKDYPPNKEGYPIVSTMRHFNQICLEFHQNQYNFPQVFFVFDSDKNDYGWFSSADPKRLYLNLYTLTHHKDEQILRILWPKVRSTIIHEWIHKKQLRLGGQRAHNAQSTWEYFDQPQEMMPWAAMEVEEMKALLRTADPNRIIRILKRLGLTGPSLKKLKQTNPKSWKRIMKNAVMYVLATSPQPN